MMEQRHVDLGSVKVGNDLPLVIIAGPCAIENRDHALRTAEKLVSMAADLGLGLVYKSSFDKANRTSLTGGRGVGMEEGLAILAEVRETLGLSLIHI